MADLFGGLVSYVGNRVAQERAFEQQKELQSGAQSYNTLMWNKANEYNTPYQQMLRFQSAGLNPNLIYGQMTGGLAAPTIGAGSSPSPAQAPAMSMLESAQIGLINAQRENIKADTREKEQNMVESGSRISLNQTQEDLNRAMQGLDEAQTKKVNEEIPLIRTEVKKSFQEYRKFKVDADRANDFYDAQIRKLQAEANLSDVEASDIVNTYKARVNLLIAQANRENWTSDQLEMQCQILGQEYVQSLYATKVAKATSSVEGNVGWQWSSRVLGLVGDVVGSVGSVMIGVGALKGAGAAASRAAASKSYYDAGKAYYDEKTRSWKIPRQK